MGAIGNSYPLAVVAVGTPVSRRPYRDRSMRISGPSSRGAASNRLHRRDGAPRSRSRIQIRSAI